MHEAISQKILAYNKTTSFSALNQSKKSSTVQSFNNELSDIEKYSSQNTASHHSFATKDPFDKVSNKFVVTETNLSEFEYKHKKGHNVSSLDFDNESANHSAFDKGKSQGKVSGKTVISSNLSIDPN